MSSCSSLCIFVANDDDDYHPSRPTLVYRTLRKKMVRNYFVFFRIFFIFSKRLERRFDLRNFDELKVYEG